MVRSPGMHEAEETKPASPSWEPRKACASCIANSIRPSRYRDRVILFAGGTCKPWLSRNGGPPPGKCAKERFGWLRARGNLMPRERFRDYFLHLEFLCPDMSEATAKSKGKSGVFLQGRYQVQVLDSFGIEVKSPARRTAAPYMAGAPRWRMPAKPPGAGRPTT